MQHALRRVKSGGHAQTVRAPVGVQTVAGSYARAARYAALIRRRAPDIDSQNQPATART